MPNSQLKLFLQVGHPRRGLWPSLSLPHPNGPNGVSIRYGIAMVTAVTALRSQSLVAHSKPPSFPFRFSFFPSSSSTLHSLLLPQVKVVVPRAIHHDLHPPCACRCAGTYLTLHASYNFPLPRLGDALASSTSIRTSQWEIVEGDLRTQFQ